MATPVGLLPDAPRELHSQSGSSVRALPSEEWRPLKTTVVTLRFLPLISLVLGGVGLAILILQQIDRGETAPGFEWRTIAAAGVVVLISILLLGFNNAIATRLVRSKVRSRRSKLFEPDGRTFIVAVEDAGTYDRFKFAPEDYALMRPSRDGIDLEMSRCQVHIALPDARLTLHSAEGAIVPTAAVNLSAELQGWTWAVALQTSAIQLRPSRDHLDPQGNALNILARIAEDADPRLVDHIPWQRGRKGLFG